MLCKKSIYRLTGTLSLISIIASFPVFTYLQSNWRTLFPSSHYYDSQILYEESSVLPTVDLKLFRTALLKFPSGFSCFYILVVQGKVTETIISTRMTHSTISLYRHYTISTLHHYIIVPLKSHNHLFNIVLIPISLTSRDGIIIISFIFIL